MSPCTPPVLTAPLGTACVDVCRAALRAALGLPAEAAHRPTDGAPAFLDMKAATFVTLRQEGELRGCVGSLEARRSLRADLEANAVSAAFHDSRFPPLSADELARTDVEVSILSPMTRVPAATEAEALRSIQPGVHGVLLECWGRRATYLPQVWEDLPSPQEFLSHLRAKAGVRQAAWDPETRLHVYTVAKWPPPEGAP